MTTEQRTKKHSRTNSEIPFKELSLTKQKIDLEWIMQGLEKPFTEKYDKNKSSQNES